MASNSYPSPSEDNTSGTDLRTNRHNRLDASKMQEITTHGGVP